jgi:PAS domain S-box-containing protein
MFLKKTNKQLVKSPNSPNLSLLFGIGILIFGILVFSVIIGRHLGNTHKPKIDNLEPVKLAITIVYLQEEKGFTLADTTSNNPHLIEAKSFINNLLQTGSFVDAFVYPLARGQEKEIKRILKEIDKYDSLIKIYAVSESNKIKINKVYFDLINSIENLQKALKEEFNSQINTLHKIQLFTLLLLTFYFVFSYLTIRNYFKLKKRIYFNQKRQLKDKEVTHYFLEESQNIAGIGYYTFDFRNNHWEASRLITDVLGMDVDEGFLQSWIDKIHPDDRHILTDVLKMRQENPNYPLDVVYRFIKPSDKKTLWIHHLAQPIQKDVQGKYLPVLGVIQDITKQKETEIALFRENQFFEKSLRKTPLAFIYIDRDSIIKIWNPAAEKIFGYPAKEAIGKNILDLIVPDDIRGDMEQVRDAIFDETGGEINQNENVTKDNKRIICKWYNSAIRDEHNKVIGITSLVEDVTKKTQLENIIGNIEHGVKAKLGKEYYNTLAKSISEALHADYIIISKYDIENNTSTTLSHIHKQKVLPNITYSLTNTPCENVLKQSYCIYPKNAATIFANDSYLKEFNISGYIGTAIFNDKQQVIGQLVAMFCKPITDESYIKTLIGFFADKIGSEIIRNELHTKLVAKQKELLKSQQIAKLGTYVLDISKGIWHSSPLLDTIFGIDDGYDKSIEGWLNVIHTEERELMQSYFVNNILKNNEVFDKEYRIERVDDKQERWVSGLGELVFDAKGKPIEMIGTIQDITDRKKIEIDLLKNRNKLEKSNRLLATLSQMNVAIALESDRQTLFQKICDIAIEIGRFKLAWIGLVDEKREIIKPIASSGQDTDYIKDIEISIANGKTSKGPTGKSVIEKRSIVFNNFEDNPDYRPWIKEALKKGYRSSAAIPIILNNKAIGAVNLYSDEPHYFDSEEIEIIEKSVINISLALEKFKEQEALKISQKNLLKTQKIAKLGSYNLNLITSEFTSSPVFDGIVGLKPNDAKTFAIWRTITHPDDAADNQKMLEDCIETGRPFEREYRIIKKDTKEIRWLYGLGEIIVKEGVPTNFIGTIQDITERKKAREDLRKSEELYRSVFDNSPLGIFYFNTAGVITESNDELIKILGSTREKIIGLNAFERFTDKKMLAALRKTLEEGKAYYNDYYTSITGNKKTSLDIHFKAIYDIESKVTGGIGLVEDITERKQAEEALKQSENKFRELYEKSADAILIIKNGIFIECNQATVKMLNYRTRKEFLDTHPSALSPKLQPDSQNSFDKAEKMIQTCLEKGTHRFEWIHTKGNGENFPVEVLLTAISNEPDNKVIHCVWRDITERKQAEDALKQSEHKLKEAHEITHLGAFIFDDRKDYFETTEICDDILGIDKNYKKDFQGWINLIHPEDYDEIQQVFDDASVKTISKEFRIIRPKDKKVIWILGHARKEYDDKGVRKLMTGTIQDITHRKVSEEKLKQSDAILNKLNSLVLVSDGLSNIIYVSPSIKDILGYEQEEVLGQGWWQLTFADSEMLYKVKKVIKDYHNSRAAMPIMTNFRKIKTKGGDYKYIEWYVSRGGANDVIAIGVDVTERHEKDIQFKKLTETAHSAIVLADDKDLIIEWNDAAVKMFGYQRQEILGQPVKVIIPEKHREKHTTSFAKANKKGYLGESGIRILEAKTKNGKIFPVELSLNTWQSQGRQIFCAFINDISERKRESQIREVIYNITKYSSNTLNLKNLLSYVRKTLDQVIDTTNFFIALYDVHTDSFSIPFRVDEEDTSRDDYLKYFKKGKTLSGYVFETKKPLLSTSSLSKSLVERGLIKEGGVKSKCWLGVPLIIGEEVIGVMAVQSYTDKKAFKEKDVALLELIASNISQVIKQSKDFDRIRLLNQALIQSPESVVVTNVNGIIEYVNPAFTILSGYSEQEAIGKNPRLLKSGDQPEDYYKNLWDTISSGKTWEGEFVNKRKNGTKYLVQANISSIKDKEGLITHYIGVEEDITEKRKLERDFIHAFIDAQEHEKQSFGEDLHDGISQILAAESMFIEVLIKQNQDRLDGKAQHLLKIKELNLSAINEARNIAHGLMSKQLKEKGLLMAVENICIDYNQTKDIAFRYTSRDLKEEEISKEIKTNIFRIIQEVSTNIIRHSGATKAEVSLGKTDKNELKLIIKDNGVGIDFKKMKREKRGAGLKNIERRVTLLNGKHNLESELNKGTCYTIIVPLENIQ